MNSINHLAGVTPSTVPESRTTNSPSLHNQSGAAPTSPTGAGKPSSATPSKNHSIYGNTHLSPLQSAYRKSSNADDTRRGVNQPNWTALVNRLNELKDKSGNRAVALTAGEVKEGRAALEALEKMSQRGVSGPLPEGLDKKTFNVEKFLNAVFCAMQINQAIAPQSRRRQEATTVPFLKAKL